MAAISPQRSFSPPTRDTSKLKRKEAPSPKITLPDEGLEFSHSIFEELIDQSALITSEGEKLDESDAEEPDKENNPSLNSPLKRAKLAKLPKEGYSSAIVPPPSILQSRNIVLLTHPKSKEELLQEINLYKKNIFEFVEKFNFSKGYEKSEFNKPTYEETKVLVKNIGFLSKFIGVESISLEFKATLKLIFENMETKAIKQTLESRFIQLKNFDPKNHADPICTRAIIEAHILALENKEKQEGFPRFLIVIRDLLNLQLCSKQRIPNMDEQTMFRQLLRLYSITQK